MRTEAKHDILPQKKEDDMSNPNFDLVIIGSGPGGYVAAIRASQLGLKTALIEKESLGGVCLNWGCIPTKALLRSAEVYNLLRHANDFGFEISGLKINFEKIIKRSREVSSKLSKGVEHLMKKNNITIISGHGKIIKAGEVEVSGQKYFTKNIIIATGARAKELVNFETDGKLIVSYKEAMTLGNLPKKLLIVGSGAIGIEFASFYNSLGSEVVVLEAKERILPNEDQEISDVASKIFTNKSIKIETLVKLKSFNKKASSVIVEYEQAGKSRKYEADVVIMAIGISANTENLGLENTKVKIENGHIVTNEFLETSESHIFAIGDVTAGPWLAHKASHEAVVCVEKISNVKGVKPIKRSLIPACTYSNPQIASIGLTEEQARAKFGDIKLGKFPFIANGKAIALGETDGFIKTIFDAKTGELLGAHMIGAEVTELIQGYALAMNLETTEHELMHTIFAHPTLSEMMHESVLDAYGKTIHI